MGRLIAITGFGGKSTVAANLSWLLSDNSLTCLFDTDLSCGSIGSFFGAEIPPEKSFTKISNAKDIDLPGAVFPVPGRNNLFLLSAHSETTYFDHLGNDSILSDDHIKELITELKNQFEYVVVDCEVSPNNPYKLWAIVYADKVINLVHPDVVGLIRAKAMKPFIDKCAKVINVLYANENAVSFSNVEAIFGDRFDVTLPFDAAVKQSVNTGVPFMSGKRSKSDYAKNMIELLKLVRGGITSGD